MPYDYGFVSLFNGKDLTGWKGLVSNPIARGKMSEAELEKTTAKVNVSGSAQLFVAQGEVLKFDGFLKVYMEGTDEENSDEESSSESSSSEESSSEES